MDVHVLDINYDKWWFIFQLNIMSNGGSKIRYQL